jgi:hypothetical protein
MAVSVRMDLCTDKNPAKTVSPGGLQGKNLGKNGYLQKSYHRGRKCATFGVPFMY